MQLWGRSMLCADRAQGLIEYDPYHTLIYTHIFIKDPAACRYRSWILRSRPNYRPLSRVSAAATTRMRPKEGELFETMVKISPSPGLLLVLSSLLIFSLLSVALFPECYLFVSPSRTHEPPSRVSQFALMCRWLSHDPRRAASHPESKKDTENAHDRERERESESILTARVPLSHCLVRDPSSHLLLRNTHSNPINLPFISNYRLLPPPSLPTHAYHLQTFLLFLLCHLWIAVKNVSSYIFQRNYWSLLRFEDNRNVYFFF